MARPPIVEQLEARQLLAGNVLAIVSGSNLTLLGDNNGDTITLTQNGAAVTIAGGGGTTITVKGGATGAAETVILPTGLAQLTLKMGTGADNVTITGQVLPPAGGTTTPFSARKGITVNMGGGGDSLLLAGIATKTLVVTDKGGNNAVELANIDPLGGNRNLASAVTGNVTIDTGAGNDTVEIAGATVGGSVGIHLGNGDNRLSIYGGAGQAHANVNTTIGIEFSTTSGNGSDTVVFGNVVNDGTVSVGEDLILALGKGAIDTVTSEVVGDLSVGGVFKLTSAADMHFINLDTVSANKGYRFTLTSFVETVNLNNVSSVAGGFDLDNLSKGTNTVNLNGVNLHGTLSILMKGRTGNTVNVNHGSILDAYTIHANGVKGVSQINLNGVTPVVIKPVVIKNFTVNP